MRTLSEFIEEKSRKNKKKCRAYHLRLQLSDVTRICVRTKTIAITAPINSAHEKCIKILQNEFNYIVVPVTVPFLIVENKKDSVQQIREQRKQVLTSKTSEYFKNRAFITAERQRRRELLKNTLNPQLFFAKNKQSVIK
jgi:UDP-glucose 6-dehydrogenase